MINIPQAPRFALMSHRFQELFAIRILIRGFQVFFATTCNSSGSSSSSSKSRITTARRRRMKLKKEGLLV